LQVKAVDWSEHVAKATLAVEQGQQLAPLLKYPGLQVKGVDEPEHVAMPGLVDEQLVQVVPLL